MAAPTLIPMTGGNENRIIDGRFELLARLGSGGMGTVWRARDSVLHREVALKEVRPPDPAMAAAQGPDVLRERVLREARSLARINHPHVVTIHHIIDDGPHPWIVMELLPGHTLQDRLARGALAPVEAAGIGRQMLSALRAAHAAGIQHRDVKPANVMLRADGTAVLTDFGIAALQGSTPLTATGDLIGSPEYIAPERIRGRDDDPASDLWSLGVVLYVCVEGVSPLRRGTTLATLAAVLDDPVPPPVRSGPLAPVLNALLVRDPAARPDTDLLDLMLSRVESGADPDWALATATSPAPSVPVGPPVPPPPTQPDSPRPVAPAVPVPGYGAPVPGQGFGPPVTQQSAAPARSRTPVIVAALAVAVALVAATALVLDLRGGSDTTADGGRGGTDGPSPTASAVSSAPSKAPSSVAPSSVAPTNGAPPTDDASPTNGAAPPPDEEAGADSGTDSGDDSDNSNTEDTGGWVAQLASTEKSAGTNARARQEAALRNKGIDNVRYVDSDAHASLRAGYWMFYVPGFGSGTQAVDWCRSRGLSTNNACVGRYLSDNADDRQYLCSPARGGGTTGRCTRG